MHFSRPPGSESRNLPCLQTSWLVNDFGFSPPSAFGRKPLHKIIHTHLTAGVDLFLYLQASGERDFFILQVCGFFSVDLTWYLPLLFNN